METERQGDHAVIPLEALLIYQMSRQHIHLNLNFKLCPLKKEGVPRSHGQ